MSAGLYTQPNSNSSAVGIDVEDVTGEAGAGAAAEIRARGAAMIRFRA